MAALSRPSSFSTGKRGEYFDPKQYMGTGKVLLIEPQALRENVQNNYNGNISYRDEVDANLTVFANPTALETGKPTSTVFVTFVHKVLTDVTSKCIGGAMAAKVSKGKKAFFFEDVSPEIEGMIEDYLEKRDAAVQAALDAAPDFD